MINSILCIWAAGLACGPVVTDQPPDDHGRTAMTIYMKQLYGGKKRKRVYTKHKRYFVPKKKSIWDQMGD